MQLRGRLKEFHSARFTDVCSIAPLGSPFRRSRSVRLREEAWACDATTSGVSSQTGLRWPSKCAARSDA